MEINLSEAEQIYIIHGAQEGFRNDGRSCEDYRPIHIETDVLNHTTGSSRVRLGDTDIIVGVKAEIEPPTADNPSVGRIQFFVDASANATPEFEGRGGEDLVQSITSALTDAYDNDFAIDLKKLCLVPGSLAWTLYVDIVLLQCGGNLFDAASFAVKAALHNTKLAKVNIVYNAEKDSSEVELTDDQFDTWRLGVENGAPLLVTISKLGNSDLVDATPEEDFCSKSQLVVSATKSGGITLVRQIDRGSLDPESLQEMIDLGVQVGSRMNSAILKKLSEEEKLENVNKRGFL